MASELDNMKAITNKLASHIDALSPIIYISYVDFTAIDNLVEQVVIDTHNIHEYNDGLGYVDFKNKNPQDKNNINDLAAFLRIFAQEERKSIFLLLKDVHFHLTNPEVIALLKSIALKTLNPKQKNFEIIILIVASKLIIPPELEKLVTILEIPPLQEAEITKIIDNFAQNLALNLNENTVKELVYLSRGLTELEIKQILHLAYQNGGTIELNDTQLITDYKRQTIKKNRSLEIINHNQNIDDIGGLAKLKSWLYKKAKIIEKLDKALEYGLDIPKGMMLIGMPGCGKSLVAKATANLFKMPLIRFNFAKLCDNSTEDNFQKIVEDLELISPCIVWINDLEKLFTGGSDGSNNSYITTRLFNVFFTWLKEKENTVFVVVTANDISQFPQNFLRRGNFDEFFWLGLPDEEERKTIFKIHLNQRKQWHKNINIDTIAKLTENFTGAEIEFVVKETLENAFVNYQDDLNTDDLIATIRATKPLYKSCEHQMQSMEQFLQKSHFKSAQ